MKAFFLALAFACVAAESDPYYGLGYAGLGYSGYAGYGLGYAGLGYAGLGYAGLGYAGLGYASPSVAYSHAVPSAVPAVAGGYAAAGRYVANSAGVVHVAKREAEAEADPYFYNAGYAGLGYAGLGYAGLGYAGLGYAGLGYAGLGYAGLNYASPSVAYSHAVPSAVPAVAGGYAAAGRYVANSAGVVHVAKREADADAEPWWSVAGYASPALAYAANPIAYGGLYNTYLSSHAYAAPVAAYSTAYTTPYAYGAYNGYNAYGLW